MLLCVGENGVLVCAVVFLYCRPLTHAVVHLIRPYVGLMDEVAVLLRLCVQEMDWFVASVCNTDIVAWDALRRREVGTPLRPLSMYRHASPERQLADTVKSVSHPPVSKEILKPQTVKGKLDAIAQSDAASQSLTRIPRGPPKTTFERTMLLPPGDPAATRPQFAKSSRAPVTSAAEFLNSSRTRSEPRPELAATL